MTTKQGHVGFWWSNYPKWSARHEKYAVGSQAWILQVWRLGLKFVWGES